MITIDKSINESVIYATLKELSTESDPAYQLELFNFYTNVTYTYDVNGTTYSNDRYDKVMIQLDSELDSKILEEGEYKYIFYEVIEDERTVIERGYLRVIDSTESEQIFEIEPDETEDDYISYSG
jgi:hypothetical protein